MEIYFPSQSNHLLTHYWPILEAKLKEILHPFQTDDKTQLVLWIVLWNNF